MPGFNGAMLRLARQFRGFHQKELADRIGVDAAILSRAENGALQPSQAVIESCAEALSVRTTFFEKNYHPSGLPLSFHPMWRKRQSVSQREVDRVLAGANIRAMHLRELMPSIIFEPELKLPQYEPGEYGRDCREIAKLVRRAWGIPAGPLINLTDYVERAGIFVFHSDLEKIDVDGLTLRLAGLPPIVVLNANLPADRMRFTLAHELAHLVMHSVPSPSEMENEANEFASGLLIPADDIRPYFKGRRIDLQLVARLKPEWRVSMAALLFAAGELGYVGPGQKQLLWKRYSAMGYKSRGEPQELNFPVEPTTLNRRLIDAHINELGYSLDDLGNLFALWPDDICTMYGLEKPRGGLRLVR
ncbi:XRE family transcriptional regulator [Mesorhizobium sp. WSM4898]|uniref:helix-turn-helix domain-containing protein n=1 Tax=Mesorhizobium sp. WSM4898 TaxID=3038544 RepID=UPI0024159211|nr:XRE family transcriptional regulator [Mesorhizobium sp. WSM4898]MDG4905986.1 XRE family transcriptional regulator [Mesorhizobium sp. WSM4898]